MTDVRSMIWNNYISSHSYHCLGDDFIFPVTICPDHANEKKRSTWLTIVVSPITRVVLHVPLVRFRRDTRAMNGFIFDTAGALRTYHQSRICSVFTLLVFYWAFGDEFHFWIMQTYLQVLQVRVAYLCNSISI